MSKIKQPRIESLVVRMAEAEAYFMGAHRVRNIQKLHKWNPALEIVYYDHASGNTVVVVKGTRACGFACSVEVHPSNASAKRRYDELRKMVGVVDINNLVPFVVANHEWTLVRYYPSCAGRVASIKKHTSKVSWGNGVKDPNVDDFKDLISNPYVLEDEDMEREMQRLFESDAPPAEDDDVVELDGQEDETDAKTGEQHPENQEAGIPSGPSPALPGMEEQIQSLFFVVVHGYDGNGELEQVMWHGDFQAAIQIVFNRNGNSCFKFKELKRSARPWKMYLVDGKTPVSVCKAADIATILYRAAGVAEIMEIIGGANNG